MSATTSQLADDGDKRGLELDAVVVGAGFSGLYMLHRVILGLAAIQRAITTPILFRTKYSRSGSGPADILNSRKFSVTLTL
jgi:hypothetical protein